MDRRKEPLYRKVNTQARGVHHKFGGEARWERNTKAGKANEASRGSMHGKTQRGLDYTPLFRFLLSRVGKDWDGVYSEAVSRLDKPDPIFWLVAKTDLAKQAVVRIGESTYYSGLYIDDDNLLAVVDPGITEGDLDPTLPVLHAHLQWKALLEALQGLIFFCGFHAGLCQ